MSIRAPFYFVPFPPPQSIFTIPNSQLISYLPIKFTSMRITIPVNGLKAPLNGCSVEPKGLMM